MLVLKTNTGTAPVGAQPLVKDALLQDASGGVPWLVHLGWEGCYSGVTPVPNAAVVENMVDDGANSSVVVAGGGASPVIAAGALDFSPVTEKGTYLSIPASVAQAIQTADQNFLFCGYFKLPTSPQWSDTSGQEITIVNFTDSADWVTKPDIFTVRLALSGGVDQLRVDRQTSVALRTRSSSVRCLPPHKGHCARLQCGGMPAART